MASPAAPQSASGGGVRPIAPQAWYIVGILTFLIGLSFLDRYILALVAQPVIRDLHLTDAQMAMLIGPGFAVVYALSGVPLAHIIDRKRRKPVLIFGVAIWSALTIAAGFAESFTTLLICRTGVAIGEAVMTPAAVSLIADLFPRERRGPPTSTFTSMISLMNMGSFLVGSGALAVGGYLVAHVGLAEWRWALILVGIPGFLAIALMLFTVREPERQIDATDEHTRSDFGSFVDYLRRHWKLWVPLYAGTALFATCSMGAVAWMPTLLVRGHGLSPAEAGARIGAVGAFAGLFGAFVWPYLSRRLDGRGTVGRGVLPAMAAACLVLLPIMLFGYTMHSTLIALVAVGFGQIAFAAAGVMPPLAVQIFGPSLMRARLSALSLMVMHLVASTSGPYAVTVFAARWPGDPLALGKALGTLGTICLPLAAACYLFGAWTWRREQKARAATAAVVTA
ncbi:MFS transporter [Sphingomonas naphthae]|uniref:MFS transporter n=1 Tax=Sphingomonas naphthae TaxID=1813468 RepID=A0ABY7TGW1_9SPHN|nr:MFS transporter [Sphingomonas naphthae]WCT72180.1 MFS transporter [Sphingomonas naphthae]